MGSDPVRSGKGGAEADPNLATTQPVAAGAFDTGRTPPSLPTSLLERYEIKRLIGTGGMGAVYEALDRNLHRIVALKVLKVVDEDPAHLGEAANRLVREARAMAVLSHRNVVTVYDVGVDGGQVYIAMQLVDGLTLRAWLAAAPRSVSQILSVLCEAGAGLAAAHAARLVHRDFKPDNVLVSRRGTARVTDFGLARRATFEIEETDSDRTSQPKVLEVDAANVTRSGAVLGTPAYMAPEQTEGKPCDARADQFSFCVTAWEALFGKRPFAGTTWSEIYGNILSGTITADESRCPRVIERALRRGLSRDPAKRFTTMDELLAILATGIERPRSWLRFAGIGAASAAVAVAITWVAKDRDPPPAPATPVASAPAPAPPTPSPAPSPATPFAQRPEPAPPSVVRVKPQSTRTKPAPAKPAAKATNASAEPAAKIATPAVDTAGLDQVRAQRSAFNARATARGLRPADWPSDITTALGEYDRALADADTARAKQAIESAQRALAAVVIDRRFIDAKLARLNKVAHVPVGREEEFRDLFAKLKGFVQRGEFDRANVMLNDLTDRLAK